MNTAQYLQLLIGNPLTACAAVLLFALAAWGIGSLILRRNDCIAFALGMFLLGWAAFLFFPLPCSFFVTTLCVVLLSFPALLGLYHAACLFHRKKLFFTAGLLLTLFFAGSALLLPTAWDEQVYQIELLCRYVTAHSTRVLPDNSYSAWPGFLQSFLLPGFYFGGLCFPRLFNSFLTVILCLTLFSKLRIYGKKTALAVSAAVFLSPLVLILNRSVYAENTTALFALAGFLVLKHLRKEAPKACFLAGLFAGAALAVKLTSGGIFLALLFTCASVPRNRKYLGLFAAGTALAALPFYLRVWICTGNPFYPFAASLFGTSTAVEQYHHLLGAFRYGLGPVYGTVFGWITTAFAGKLYDGIVSGFQQLVMLAALGAAFYFNRGKKSLKILKIPFCALLILYLFWGMTSQQTRFLFPAFFLLAFLAAAALRSLEKKYRHLLLGLLLAAIFCTPTLLPHIKHNFIAWRIVGLPWKEPLKFLAAAQKDPDFIHLLEAAGKTPSQSRFLLLFEKRGLYLPRKHEIADPGFQEKYFKTLPDNVDDFLRALGKADYLLLGSGEKDVDLQEKQMPVREKLTALAAAALAEGKMEPVASGKSCYLLKIKRLKK